MVAKKVVLFVDDEPNILSGLKRMLHTLRKELEMNFVGSGKEALEFLRHNHVDVIVSDMRMPVMDGATLLKKVQESYPHVMRIVLSGHADITAIFETVGVAHQFLAKPTSAEILKETVLRACSLQDLLSNPSLVETITKIGDLPSLPSVYSELQNQLKDADCPIEDIAGIIEKDMAMSAKVLQLVNSAFFGLFTKVESPARAVKLLGLDTIKGLVLSVGIFSELTQGKVLNLTSSLWDHSIQVAAYARHICYLEKTNEDCTNNTFIAGLLHDVGKLLFLVTDGMDYGEILRDAKESNKSVYYIERQHLHSDHSEAGGYLTGLWGSSRGRHRGHCLSSQNQ